MSNFNLEKSVNLMSSSASKFNDAVEKFNTMIGGQLFDLELQLKEGNAKVEALEKEYQTKLADFRIQLAQDVKSDELKTATDLAEKHGYTLVLSDKYSELQSGLIELQFDREELINTVTLELNEKAEKSKQRALRQKDLEHAATMATINAKNEELTGRIEFLKTEQDRMVEELNKTRELAQAVAASKTAEVNIHEKTK